MADVLTKEQVKSAVDHIERWLGCDTATASDLGISHELLRAERDRLRDALRDAEQRARQFPATGASCLICAAYADREFGRVSVDISHRPTCPFATLHEREGAIGTND